MTSFDNDDPRMAFAIDEAKQTLRTFFDVLAKPKANQTGFLVKAKFSDGNMTEHIWLADINPAVFPLEGTVANEPALKDLKFMQRITFHPEQITDWMYLEDGYLVGGFTTQVIRSSMTPSERADHDAQAPFKFRD